MSGRKQHYIPQFMLRSFGKPAGSVFQVRVVKSSNSYISPTLDAAAQRDFYSSISEPDETLDHVITREENDYAAILRDLLAAPVGVVSDPFDLCRLLTHLTIRGNHTRASLTAAGAYALHRARDLFANPTYLKKALGIDNSSPNAEMKDAFDAEYNKRKSLLSKQRVSRHEFRRVMYSELQRKYDSMEQDVRSDMAFLASSVELEKAVISAHKKILLNAREPVDRVRSLSLLKWELVDLSQPILILPDCVGLAQAPSGTVVPVAFVDNEDMVGALFPISPTRLACGGTLRQQSLLNATLDQFCNKAAGASWEFTISHPDFPHAEINSELIGQQARDFILRIIETSVQQDLIKTLSL